MDFSACGTGISAPRGRVIERCEGRRDREDGAQCSVRDTQYGGQGSKAQGGARAAIIFDGRCCGCGNEGRQGRDQKEEVDKEALSEWRRDEVEGAVMRLTCSKNGLGHMGALRSVYWVQAAWKRDRKCRVSGMWTQRGPRRGQPEWQGRYEGDQAKNMRKCSRT